MAVSVIEGDMRAVLPTLPADHFHACVCDPPYHLHSITARFAKSGRTDSTTSSSGPHQRTARGFMGKQWDGGDIAFRPETWAEVFRVLRPGAYILAFSSSRTFGRMSVALEDAGFITHPMIGWVFGQGFPKAKRLDADLPQGLRYGGQALKPALEPIYVGQKPMEGTGSANWRKWGCGALNVDRCRVALDAGDPLQDGVRHDGRALDTRDGAAWGFQGVDRPAGLGRWPANLIHDGSDEVLAAFPEAVGQQGDLAGTSGFRPTKTCFGDMAPPLAHTARGDAGSAARFFYAAKADASDRLGSKHATVKPQSLMRYLVRLVTPSGGHVLDPFAGSGSTGQAAMAEGMDATLVELEAESVADCRRRVAHVQGADTPLFAAPPV